MASSSTSSDSQRNVHIVGATAVVEWSASQDQTCYLAPSGSSASEAGNITFDLHFRPATNTASLSLRAPILLKGLGRKTTPLYLMIAPERIESMHFVGQEGTQTPEAVQRELGSSGVVSLRIKLTQPGDLVAPPHTPLVLKKRIYWDIFDSLRSLAQVVDFVLYLNLDKIPSVEDVRHVADELCTGNVATSVPHADISRLYEGKGGRLLTGSELTTSSTSAPGSGVDSPPSYDQLEPGPPAPAIGKTSCQHTVEPSSSSSSSNRKRRRSNSPSTETKTTAADSTQVELVCRKLIGELASQLRAENTRQLRHELDQLESRLRGWIDERLQAFHNELQRTTAQHQDRLDDAVVGLGEDVALARDEAQDTMVRIDEVQDALARVPDETAEMIDGRVEERVAALRAELEEDVADQIHAAEDRVIDRLRASVFIDFNIYDT